MLCFSTFVTSIFLSFLQFCYAEGYHWFQGEREDCPDTDDYVATILHPLLKTWNADDIYNADETALYYKQLPGSTLTFREDTPGGSKMNKACLTLLLITNMSSSDKRKVIVIGKSTKPVSQEEVRHQPGADAGQLLLQQEGLDEYCHFHTYPYKV